MLCLNPFPCFSPQSSTGMHWSSKEYYEVNSALLVKMNTPISTYFVDWGPNIKCHLNNLKEHAGRKTFATWHSVRYVTKPTPDVLWILSKRGSMVIDIVTRLSWRKSKMETSKTSTHRVTSGCWVYISITIMAKPIKTPSMMRWDSFNQIFIVNWMKDYIKDP